MNFSLMRSLGASPAPKKGDWACPVKGCRRTYRTRDGLRRHLQSYKVVDVAAGLQIARRMRG